MSILTCICNEPEGQVIRTVSPLQITEENIRIIWEKTKPFKTVLNKEFQDNFEAFTEIFYTQINGQIISDSLFWVVDNFIGLYYITDIKDTEALAHFTFFDRRFHGRLNMTKEMLKFMFNKYKFQRLNVEVPVYARPATLNFVRHLGFLNEGRKRKCMQFDGKFFDAHQFGLLRSEVL